MSRSSRSALISLAAVAALLVLVVGAFALDRGLHRGQVLRNVVVGGADLSGLAPPEAEAAVLSYEDVLAEEPAPFDLDGEIVELEPTSVGFRLDTVELVDTAMARGRTGTLLSQFRWWLQHVFATDQIEATGSINPEDLEAVLRFWDEDVIGSPPFDGAVVVEDDNPVPAYPVPGRGVDRTTAPERILASLLEEEREPVSLAIVAAPPALGRSQVDSAVATARVLLQAPITLRRADPEAVVTFTTTDLASALISEVMRQPSPYLEVGFDAAEVAKVLEPLREELEIPPRDARLVIGSDNSVSIEEGRPGSVIDPELVAEELRAAGLRSSRSGILPFERGAEPEVTTEDIAALGITGLVSQFTTYHDCCQNRVVNIHLIADLVDGTIVMPGEEFSLNDHVGERTAERGFLPAGTIIAGEIVDTVGGGVSQFATTFYNAVFWGGFEDVTHAPHSFYFSRYPEGIEATISWPAPNLVFRNDSAAAVFIKTEYTDTSITVKFFGGNEGLAIAGEQSNGTTKTWLASEGTGRRVTASVSDRFNITDPKVEYVANPDRDPEEPKTLDRGAQGWSVTVTRTITYPDGREDEQKWVVRYRSQPQIIEAHPCMIPKGADGYTGEECPPEETTTTEPAPTTTAPAETSTTPPPTTAP